ncbi:DUF2231 domain-containing protein [Nocardioides terrisoli]|uniref:DUF2231 domain-containing protein n=1 Tax=Nocardioides terrisoli TaxID=3388267 RepID=UPI00287B8196|nr:DUF2231 domain-containing protein [Nocardioides marmorisolisilvae]
MEVNGLPLHPLVIHVAVVFVPLAALGVLGYAVVPRWRRTLRWPMLVATVIAAVAVQVSAMSGSDLKRERGLGGVLLDQHEMWAGRLQFATWVLAAVVVLAFFVAPSSRRRLSGAGSAAAIRLIRLALVLRVVLVLFALAELYLVVRTGDAGAKAVWATSQRG